MNKTKSEQLNEDKQKRLTEVIECYLNYKAKLKPFYFSDCFPNFHEKKSVDLKNYNYELISLIKTIHILELKINQTSVELQTRPDFIVTTIGQKKYLIEITRAAYGDDVESMYCKFYGEFKENLLEKNHELSNNLRWLCGLNDNEKFVAEKHQLLFCLLAIKPLINHLKKDKSSGNIKLYALIKDALEYINGKLYKRKTDGAEYLRVIENCLAILQRNSSIMRAEDRNFAVVNAAITAELEKLTNKQSTYSNPPVKSDDTSIKALVKEIEKNSITTIENVNLKMTQQFL